MIAIVDYDVGNLKNVYTALGDVGLSGTITRVNEISAAIAAAVEQQRAATAEIARNVQQASAGTSTSTWLAGAFQLLTKKRSLPWYQKSP